MTRATRSKQKELMDEFDLARQAFNASHKRLKDAEKSKSPPSVLRRYLKQHLTAAACLLAMARANLAFRRRQALA